MRLTKYLAAIVVLCALPLAAGDNDSFLARLHNIHTLASTVPPNGDVNPYGIAVVPATAGMLTRGNVLVSNFNAVSNIQGTGTTIVQIAPGG